MLYKVTSDLHEQTPGRPWVHEGFLRPQTLLIEAASSADAWMQCQAQIMQWVVSETSAAKLAAKVVWMPTLLYNSDINRPGGTGYYRGMDGTYIDPHRGNAGYWYQTLPELHPRATESARRWHREGLAWRNLVDIVPSEPTSFNTAERP